MRSFIKRHIALFGYLFIVAATALVLEWHHDITTKRLRQLQTDTCIRATVLAENQAVVIRSLVSLIEIENQDEAHENLAKTHIVTQLEELKRRLASVPEFDCE